MVLFLHNVDLHYPEIEVVNYVVEPIDAANVD